MRRVVVLLLSILVLIPKLSARNKSDWANVQLLKPGTPVTISLWAGYQLRGTLEAVNDSGLSLTWLDAKGNLIQSSYHVDRASVRKIVRFRHPKLPQDPGRIMLIATVAGAAVGATAGGIDDATDHNSGRWFTGGLGGAGIGFFGSCVVLGGIGATKGGIMLFHRSTVVYEDRDQHTPKSSSVD